MRTECCWGAGAAVGVGEGVFAGVGVGVALGEAVGVAFAVGTGEGLVPPAAGLVFGETPGKLCGVAVVVGETVASGAGPPRKTST
ncbi:MAG: hypothetical protein L0312_25605, partial [Acidobacteria bacterium]|nr:hypothetical protein [Acidobacteriota bacterium]